MKNRRWSDQNWHLWPFTLSYSEYKFAGMTLSSGAREGGKGDCYISVYAFGWWLACELPRIIPHYRERHVVQHGREDFIARMGRDWYDELFSREYGFSFSGEGSLHVYYGPQTHSSDTTKSRCIFLPWLSWRFIRHSHYDLKGNHFHTESERYRNSWEASFAIKDACPVVRFGIEDFDGQHIVATTRIEEREWRFGTGWFRWLSWFRAPNIRRTLNIEFSSETGKEKGSWKGGTMGTGIEMLPGELHEAAFKRYCQNLHRSKHGTYRVRYLGLVEA